MPPRVNDDNCDRAAAGVGPRTSAESAAPAFPYAAGLGLLVAACGDGGGGSSGGASGGSPAPAASATPGTPVTVVTPPPTPAQASRFLIQATMGATRSQIDEVVSSGYGAWLDKQFAMPRETSHVAWLTAKGYDKKDPWSYDGFDNTIWRQLIAAPDQLRQRMAVALLDILVVGIDAVNLSFRAFGCGAYVDIMADNAFGNYRTILEKITYSSVMGSFLTFLDSRAASPSSAARPDENYAREIMQLFTIGLYQLNMDGSQKTSGGNPIETYTNDDVSGLARAFSGFVLGAGDNSTPTRTLAPLRMWDGYHETGPSTFLGTTVSGDGTAAVKKALDTLFGHPNVPPFVSRQLIQRLVTSNPSPAYIQRVATVFADNGSGVRGDLKAVVRAILTDSEARSDATLSNATAGRLRSPVERFTAWARAFNVTSPSDSWAIGGTMDAASQLGQTIGHSPTVFNFFQPGYTPAGSPIAAQGLVAPEFQLANEQSVVGYVNFMYGVIANGVGDVKTDYAAILAKAPDSVALVSEVNLLLAAGQLSDATVQTIRSAVDSIAASDAKGPINRVGVAILLTVASPEFMVVR